MDSNIIIIMRLHWKGQILCSLFLTSTFATFHTTESPAVSNVSTLVERRDVSRTGKPGNDNVLTGKGLPIAFDIISFILGLIFFATMMVTWPKEDQLRPGPPRPAPYGLQFEM